MRSIDSLRSMAVDPDRVELLVGYDADDEKTGDKARSLGSFALRFPERFGYPQLHLYVNRLAEFATGEWLLLWNDDALMTTRNWDSVFSSYSAALMYVLNLSSTKFGHSQCCFPAISRSLYARLGHMSLSNHIDTWLQDLGNSTGILRNVPVHVHHDRFDLTGGHNDQIFAEGQAGYRPDEFNSPAMRALLHADIRKVLSCV